MHSTDRWFAIPWLTAGVRHANAGVAFEMLNSQCRVSTNATL
jgi:hypothetical protein